MQKKIIQGFYKELTINLTERQFLKGVKLSKKALQDLLALENWPANIEKILDNERCTCQDVLTLCAPAMAHLAPEPTEGWLAYTYQQLEAGLFPEREQENGTEHQDIAMHFYLQVLNTFLDYEQKNAPFDPMLDFDFLSEDQLTTSGASLEYRLFLQDYQDAHIYAFMRIGREIQYYDTLSHIAGVHFIAMHIARQMFNLGVPIDLALISGAAAGHDFGKFGCRDSEADRVPYLHYYYTDQWFIRHDMPLIGHIAANHSAWDLELENLSVESLVLIYADFRVKRKPSPEPKEVMHFYTLAESFDVILNKLDNVDETKRQRYLRVYAALQDFEDYMHSLGINTDLTAGQVAKQKKKAVALLTAQEVIKELKHLAIEQNIAVMHKLNNETSFGNILEAARSEKNWKNIRGYLNIFQEYVTYMTKKQKVITVNFLYELLIHREGDIRRQAAQLMGDIIVHYDAQYCKEIPAWAPQNDDEISKFDLWQKYLRSIIIPDHKMTDQHKRWIGFALKTLTRTVLTRCKINERKDYLADLLVYFDDVPKDNLTAFIMLDVMLILPLELCPPPTLEKLTQFARTLWPRPSEEIQVSVLRFMAYLTTKVKPTHPCLAGLPALLEEIPTNQEACLDFLKLEITCHLTDTMPTTATYDQLLARHPEGLSEIFLENLKAATPWTIKAVNIDLLQGLILTLDHTNHVLHVATHLSNLLKIDERITIRHAAGQALVAIAPLLSRDQRNEVAIELTKGLEIGEYEFSKYIPDYLGEFALYLFPKELDELLNNLKSLLDSANDRIASVALNALGVLIQKYPQYQTRFGESEEIFIGRRNAILGLLLKGLANYREAVSQEALLVIGQNIFGSTELSYDHKFEIYDTIYKRMLTLIQEQSINGMTFFNNAASLNHIYRFVTDYIFYKGAFNLHEPHKVAFFPGTFDPFSLSHKGIVQAIRNMGFDVYLAVDEFSWSKKTQPRMVRRRIITMSTADEEFVHLFPDDIPVNLSNPADLKKLRALFPDKEVYIVVGSDVIDHASAYQAPPQPHSIHTFNHIIFNRSCIADDEPAEQAMDDFSSVIQGEVLWLTLPVSLEYISSTRIRENIDRNRDISNLIDPMAQNFIYDKGLYLREGQYKPILKTKAVKFQFIEQITDELMKELSEDVLKSRAQLIKSYLKSPGLQMLVMRDAKQPHKALGFLAFHELNSAKLYEEFNNAQTLNYVRKTMSGKILVMGALYTRPDETIKNMEQLLLTETLAYCLCNNVTWAIYNDQGAWTDPSVLNVLDCQGFKPLPGSYDDHYIYAANLSAPIILLKNIDMTIKEPFNKNPRVLQILDTAHQHLQRALTALYPDNLVLSFDASVLHYQLMEKITRLNQVPIDPLPEKTLGKYMCVPYGKIMRGIIVPNTITKAIYTDKVYDPDVSHYKIVEFPDHSPLANQAKAIKSFQRPVILVDDVLHKGNVLNVLAPLLEQEEVTIKQTVVGILSGKGQDLMDQQKRTVDPVHFIPNLKAWFVESTLYPFIGGDSVRRERKVNSSLMPLVNMILPYVAPRLLADSPKDALYQFSMACLENALAIMNVLEEEYQALFERNLTLNRLSETIISPGYPDYGACISYDLNLAPSVYLTNDLEKLLRLKNLVF